MKESRDGEQVSSRSEGDGRAETDVMIVLEDARLADSTVMSSLHTDKRLEILQTLYLSASVKRGAEDDQTDFWF